jgi:transcriptional regulator with PAS, ATPase and Fis domain
LIQFKDLISRFDYKISRDTTLRQAIQLMLNEKWELLPVTDDKGCLLGVFTRSEMHRMILDEKSLDTSICPYMKKDALTLQIDTPYEEIEQRVLNSRVGTGVVVDKENKFLGLFTKPDMVLALLRSTHVLKEQLETILDYSHIGVLMTDDSRNIIYLNDRLITMSEKSAGEMMGRKIEEVFAGFSKILSGKQSEFRENYVSISFNRYKTIAFVTKYQTGIEQNGYIALFQDISEIERMAEELQTVKKLKTVLQTALEYAYDGLVMINKNQTIEMVSPPLLDFFDLSLEHVIGQSAEKVFPELQLSHVFQSENAELSNFKERHGIKYIVHRIPIIQDGQVIGAIGKVMYRQLNQVNELFKKLQKAESKANFYQKQYKQAESAKFNWDHIITLDSSMERLKKSGAKAAKGRSTVLIRGESGTGKELFAHAIHNSSARSEEKFVIVNCAAIPEDLLESEFFGYEEGAFTGAKQRGKLGKFDLANGGTLFLDEIGDMSLSLQAKLLRVLQEREFYRVGGTTKIKVDVRIIAATNRNLEEMVQKGQFREDLYFRLNVISLHIPPLRERKGDLDYLLTRVMSELNTILGTSITGIEPKAKEVLYRYDWPGNVRELKNVLERAMTFAEYGKIQLEDLPDYLLSRIEDVEDPQPVGGLFEDAERSAIKKALQQSGGNKAEAARILGISRSGLYEKIKKYGVLQ